MPDQFPAHRRFEALELLVDGTERDAARVEQGLRGGADLEPDLADDQAPKIDQRGDQQLWGVLRRCCMNNSLPLKRLRQANHPKSRKLGILFAASSLKSRSYSCNNADEP